MNIKNAQLKFYATAGMTAILREQFGEFVLGMIMNQGEHIFQVGKQLDIVPLSGGHKRIDNRRARYTSAKDPLPNSSEISYRPPPNFFR